MNLEDLKVLITWVASGEPDEPREIVTRYEPPPDVRSVGSWSVTARGVDPSRGGRYGTLHARGTGPTPDAAVHDAAARIRTAWADVDDEPPPVVGRSVVVPFPDVPGIVPGSARVTAIYPDGPRAVDPDAGVPPTDSTAWPGRIPPTE